MSDGNNGTVSSGTATSATGQSYTGSVSGKDVTFSNLPAGTYTVTVVHSSGCKAQLTGITLTAPAAFAQGTITPGNKTICATETRPTVGSTTGASSGSGTITYEWRIAKTGGTTTTVNTNAATFTPTAAQTPAGGTYTITRWAKDGVCQTTFVQSTGSYTLTVLPDVKMNQPDNLVKEHGESVAVTFSGTPTTGVTYNWEFDPPVVIIGQSSNSGSGPLNFTANNTGMENMVATVTVTPTYKQGVTTCTGTPKTFTITVKPGKVEMDPVENQTLCSDSNLQVAFTAPDTYFPTNMSYIWSRNKTTEVTGIDANGTVTGTNKLTGTLVNTTGTVQVVTFTVTPSYTVLNNTLTGDPVEFTVTVRPAVNITCTDLKACAEDENVELKATVTNAAAGNHLTWSFGEGASAQTATGTTTAAATQTATANFSVPEVSATSEIPYTITYNDNVCSASKTANVHVTKVTLTETAGAHTDVTCFGGADGELKVAASGGTEPYTYSVAGIDGTNTTGKFTGLRLPADAQTGYHDSAHPTWETVSGDYTVHVQDANHCVAETTVSLFSPAKLRWENCPENLTVCCDAGAEYALLIPGTDFQKPDLNTYANISNISRQVRNNLQTNGHYTSSRSPYSIEFLANTDAVCNLKDTCRFTITVRPNPSLSMEDAATAGDQKVCLGNAIKEVTLNYDNATVSVAGLPNGVTISAAGGVATISGTPANLTEPLPHTYNYTITAVSDQTDGNGDFCEGNTKTLTGKITVNPVQNVTLSVTGDITQSVCAGTAITNVKFATGGTIAFKNLPAGLSASETAPYTLSGTPTAGGRYTVTASDTYGCSKDSITGTITVKPQPTLTIDQATQPITYGASMEVVHIEYANATVSLTNQPAWMTTATEDGVLTLGGTPTAVGTYEVTVTATSTQGCADVSKKVKVVVDPLAVTVNITGNNDTKTYDAAEHEVTGYTATATSALYKVSGDTPDFGLKTGETAAAKRTDVGMTDMGLTPAKFENHNSNFTVTFAIAADGYMEIEKAAITIKADDKTKVYDNDAATDPALTATVTGVPASGVAPVYSLSRVAGQDVGGYAITVAAEATANPNYTVSVEGGTFSITPADRKSTRLNSSNQPRSRMPSSA